MRVTDTDDTTGTPQPEGLVPWWEYQRPESSPEEWRRDERRRLTLHIAALEANRAELERLCADLILYCQREAAYRRTLLAALIRGR